MTKTTDQKTQCTKTAIKLAGERGWNNITMTDIADACGINLEGLRTHFDDKVDILASFGKMIDRQVLADFEAGENIRENLFDLLMDRFEALNEYRDGVISVLQSFKTDPKRALISAPVLCRSMEWMLEAAGVNTTGFTGVAKIAALTALDLKVACTWMKDDTADLSKTMAALDKDLGRLEGFADRFGF